MLARMSADREPASGEPGRRDPWEPGRYARFSERRARPFLDLLGLLAPCEGARVLDLGCGTGEATARLHAHLGASATLGVDRSEAMLEPAALLADHGLRFRCADLRDVLDELAASGERVDVVVSNAALQWVDDHEDLLARLRGVLAPGGQLALQMPCNDAEPSHRAVELAARDEPFASALGGWVRRSPVLAPGAYARALFALGFEHQHVRLVVYDHVLASREVIVDWLAGTTLTAYERRLPGDLHTRFVQHVAATLGTLVPDERPCFLPFHRTLVWARLPMTATRGVSS